MNDTQQTIYVYENWTNDDPILIGKLYVQCVRGEEIFSFEYLSEWLQRTKMPTLDPDLEFFAGKQYLLNEKKQFGIFTDSEPDRWGRTLLKRKENILAQKEGRTPRNLYETDFLLGVDDLTRMGALRFKLDKNGPFLSENDSLSVPPIKRLREIENVSLKYESEDNDISDEWLDILFAPGSSLGGARPKANVIDQDGSLWIAKFPSKHDEYDVGAWEYVAHDLARLCGLNVPEARLQKFSNKGSTIIIKRFDRNGKRRIHFASAITLLGKSDGDSSESSYVDLANFIKGYGTKVKEDLNELWKRIVFSMLIKNTDDHLRNHGFLLEKNGWRLSPMYDVNPTPNGTYLSLNVIGNLNKIDLNLPLAFAKYFEMPDSEAKEFIMDCKSIILENWLKLAKENGISKSSIDYMRSAFENN